MCSPNLTAVTLDLFSFFADETRPSDFGILNFQLSKINKLRVKVRWLIHTCRINSIRRGSHIIISIYWIINIYIIHHVRILIQFIQIIQLICIRIRIARVI